MIHDLLKLFQSSGLAQRAARLVAQRPPLWPEGLPCGLHANTGARKMKLDWWLHWQRWSVFTQICILPISQGTH